MPLAGVLVQYIGWSSVFYIYGELPNKKDIFHQISTASRLLKPV